MHSVGEALEIGSATRRRVERRVADRIARQIAERLPTDESQQRDLVESGYKLAKRMSWDEVAQAYIMPTVDRIGARRPALHIA